MDNNEEGKQMSRMQDEWLLMNSEVEFMEACFDLLSNPVKGVDESGLLVPDNDFLYRWQRASHFMNVALERRENADVLVGLGDPSAVVAKVLSVFTTLKADQVCFLSVRLMEQIMSEGWLLHAVQPDKTKPLEGAIPFFSHALTKAFALSVGEMDSKAKVLIADYLASNDWVESDDFPGISWCHPKYLNEDNKTGDGSYNYIAAIYITALVKHSNFKYAPYG